jgi:hypothetical protein
LATTRWVAPAKRPRGTLGPGNPGTMAGPGRPSVNPGAPGGTQQPWALKLILIGTWAQRGPMTKCFKVAFKRPNSCQEPTSSSGVPGAPKLPRRTQKPTSSPSDQGARSPHPAPTWFLNLGSQKPPGSPGSSRQHQRHGETQGPRSPQAGCKKEKPRVPGHPGGSRRFQADPGRARRSQEVPGRAKRTQEDIDGPRKTQEPRGAPTTEGRQKESQKEGQREFQGPLGRAKEAPLGLPGNPGKSQRGGQQERTLQLF